MICPRCGKALCQRMIDQIPIDKCEGCHGVWFDFAEFDWVRVKARRNVRLVFGAKGRIAIPSNDAPGGMSCPRCGGELLAARSAENPELEVETCLSCYGQWIDGDELDRARNVGLIKKFMRLLRRIW